MGTPTNPSRFAPKPLPDEPIFTLLGRDRSAGNLIREWAKSRIAEGESGDHIMEALSVAADMDRYAITYHSQRPATVAGVDE